MSHITIEEVARLFPDRSFAVFRVERGNGTPEDARKLVWMAQWYAGYFTSDTDRHVYHEGSQSQFFGDTPEEALRAMIRGEVLKANAAVVAARARLAAVEIEQKAIDDVVREILR